MKTFDEAFQVLKVPVSSGGPDPVEIENVKDLARSIRDSPHVRKYFQEVMRLLLKRTPNVTAEQFAESLAATVFAGGVRVGQEMEKAE